MARESLKSATDGHVVVVKSAVGGPVSGKPTSDKFTISTHVEVSKAGYSSPIEYGGDFTCRKNTDIPFVWFKK